jgi:hypothetical protein
VWVHNVLAGLGLTWIVLDISLFDVDFDLGELDMIGIFDSFSWIGFGDLVSSDNI